MQTRFTKKAKVFDIGITAVAGMLSVVVMLYGVFHFGLPEAGPELVLNLFYIACLVMICFFHSSCLDVKLLKLLVCYVSGRAHHDILCVLVHRERNDLSDRVLSCKKHDHTVNSGSDSCVRRCSVAECVVHGRELSLNVFFAKSYHLKSLYHDLGIVVTNSSR